MRRQLVAALCFGLAFLTGGKEAAAYCNTGLGGATYAWISLVSITGTSLNNPSGMAASFYTNWPASGNTTATLMLGSTYTLNTTYDNSSGGAISSLWIDWNQNNLFETSEWTQITTNSNSVATTFTVPLTATPGTTVMRIRSRGTGNTNGAGDACTNFGSGETEDYTITVMSPVPCSGTPTPGTAVASPSSICPGSTATLALNGQTIASGIDYQWESQDPVTLAWSPIAGATAPTYTTPALTTSTAYRATLTCTNGSPAPAPATSTAATVNVSAPIVPTYTETFESITANNQLPNCMVSTNLGGNTRTYTATYTGNQTNHTPGGSKFGMFYYSPSGTNAFITPALSLQAGTTYLFTYWYVGYSATPAGITTLDAYYGPSNNLAGMVNFIGTVTPTNTTYQQFSQSFTPQTTGIYYIGIVATSTSGANYYVSIDDLNLNALAPCSGRPVAGTINAPTPCPNAPFTLSRTGGTNATVTGNINYQWQDSTSTGWQNSIGATATSTSYTTAINVPTKYRVILTCTNGGQSDTSASVWVNVANYLTCYCTSTATSTADDDIGNVQITTQPAGTVLLNNGVATPVPSNSTSNRLYTDFTALPPTNLYRDSTYKVRISQINSGSTVYTCTAYGFIDYNHSGSFEPNEMIITQVTSSSSTPQAVVSQNFTIPTNALIGVTRMRLVLTEGTLSSYPPCGTYTWGETEDYMVNISYPPCNGPTNAGTAVASASATCKGYTIDLADTTHEYFRSQISWSWQSSTDGGLTWNAVPNSANKDTLKNILINGPVSYRLKMMCDATGDSTFSVPANIAIKAPYACYCYSQANGGPLDTADIGAVVIGAMVNSTGGPHILNPVAIRNRTDYTGIPNIILNANTRYRLSIYHTQLTRFHADARVSVFIDFNNDLVYDVNASPNSERVFTGISTESNFYIDTVINVPDAVIPNVPTGMRVILNNDLNPNSPANLGCGPYTSGETEDYIIQFNRVPAGVGGVMNLEAVSLYPNPTSGKFTIHAMAGKTMEKVEVSVTTVSGQTVVKKSYNGVGNKFTEELDLTEAAKGFYFVEIRTANGDKMVKKLSVK